MTNLSNKLHEIRYILKQSQSDLLVPEPRAPS